MSSGSARIRCAPRSSPHKSGRSSSTSASAGRRSGSCRSEAEADWMALNATRDPSAARGLFKGFVTTDLQNPDPPGWVHVFLENHPSALVRVEQAEAWRHLKR